MSRNLFVGANLATTFTEKDADARRAVGDVLEAVERSGFEARAEAFADEIAAADPHLVGLQEVSLIREQRPGDNRADPGLTNARRVRLDYLELLLDELDARGLDYRPVGVGTNADVELPARVDAGDVDVRLTDRDVVLARGDVTVRRTWHHVYDAALPVPLDDDVTATLSRGYVAAAVAVDGVPFTFVTTHLESVSASVQVEQARELVVALGDRSEPTVLVGDFNTNGDGSSTVTYDLLTTFFEDAWTAVNPDDPGPTCCQPKALENPKSKLDHRIDLVLARGPVRPLAATRTGAHRRDRVTFTHRGETRRVWPSDHAGVVSTLRVSAAEESAAGDGPTGDARATPSDESADRSSETVVLGDSTNSVATGFDAVLTLVAFVLALVALVRRRGSDD